MTTLWMLQGEAAPLTVVLSPAACLAFEATPSWLGIEVIDLSQHMLRATGNVPAN